MALTLVGAAVSIRIGLLGGLEMRLAYITLYPAVTAACVIGGLFAGLFATVFSAVIASFWLAPLREAVDYLGLATFLLSCGLIIGVTEAMHRARARALDAEARAKVSDALRESDAALRDSQARLAAVVNNAVDGIIVIDAKGLIQSLNPAALAMFQYEMREIVGRNVSVLMPEPHRSAHPDYLNQYLATRQAKVIGIGREAEARRKDGALFPIELAVSEILIDDQQLFVGFVRDISERKRAEERQQQLTAKLQESESEARQQQALFQGVFDSTPEAMFLTNTDRRIILINPAFKRLLGYELADLAGSGHEAIYADREDSRHISQLPPVASDKTFGQPHPARFKRKNGEAFPGEILIGPYRDAAHRPLGYVGIVRDLTLELQQEDARRQSQKLEALGQLTGGIAHDFNNILTTIIGNHEFLESKVRGSDEWDALRRANNAAQMAARLTSRLLTFARRRRLEPVVVNLNELVATITDLLRRTLGETVALDLNLAAELDSVRADVSEVENTIINLALNARDAMPHGGRLTIETCNIALEAENIFQLSPGSYVGVFVTDTGVGMKPEVAERAFEPFFSTKGPGRGTGLGLSTVYGFAEQSGGAVKIESVVGRGTTVKVLLPRVDLKSSPTAESQQIPFSRFAETVLVVEDDPDVRETTMRRVEGLGYVAIDAASGPAAIRVLESGESIDLVFSDVAMPGGMSGYDLANWISARRPDIKMLLTSGHVDPSRSGKPVPDGEFDLLDKPYSRAELAQALARALKYES